MHAKQSIHGSRIGRTVIGAVALAAALACGSLAAATAEGAAPAAAAGCGVSAPPATVAATGVEWSSSATAPGKPY